MCFLWACEESREIIDEISSEKEAIVLSLSLSGSSENGFTKSTLETEPGITSQNENRISRIFVYIFDKDMNFVHRDDIYNLNINASNTQSLKLSVDQTKFKAEQKYNLYFVTNTDTQVSSWYDLQRALSSSLVSNESMNSMGPLMDAKLENIELVSAENNAIKLNVNFKRACAKIRMNVHYSKDFPTAIESNMTVKLMNYASHSSLIEDGFPYTGLTTNGFIHPPTNNDDPCDVRFYCYENDWNDDPSRETFIVIKRPVRVNGQYVENNYYKVPVNFRLPEDSDSMNPSDASHLYKIERNHIYDITVLIDKLGSEDSADPTWTGGNYSVKEWDAKDVVIDVEDFQWLWVRDDTLYMNDINTTSTIFYSSSSDLKCTISNVKIYNQETEWSTGTAGMSAVADQAQQGIIRIESTVPDQFTGKSFTVTVSSAMSGKSARIHVNQFPQIFLTLHDNITSVSAGNGQNNSSVYEIRALLPDFSSLPEDLDEFELNESGFTHPGTLANRQNKALTVVRYLKENAIYGYPRTEEVYYNSIKSTIYNKETTVSGVTAQVTSETVNNSRMVSPRFLLASQGGANSYSTYDAAKQNCAGYRESVKDASGKTIEYGTGTWRMPTYAELLLIDLLQNLKNSMVKKILEGQQYQHARFNNVNSYTMMDYRVTNTHAVRCVRDIK